METEHEFEAIVIGTGFAGAITACRLVQAGLRICVLERGRRYEADDFPVYPPTFSERIEEGAVGLETDLTRLLWSTGRGLWDLRNLGDVFVAQAAGYGGGSLIYANVHLRAPKDVFESGWPPEYRSLDDYYDLAAYMLGATPIPEDLLPRKTAQLQRAAKVLGDQFSFFRTPLAVNFSGNAGRSDGESKNEWGRMQGVCDLRGDCCFGCPKKAKNTLDLNYLAVVEDAKDKRGEPLADIRTQAEVVSIKSLGEGKESGFRVEYENRFFEGTELGQSVTAPYVFLCAGAVNTTELLLRGWKRHLKLTAKPGDRYHTNADGLSVVFDCDQLQETDRGPTIGGALLHRSESEWLLIQDGGLPEPLEPLLGLYRSPLWAGRNRFRESERDLDRGQPAPYAPLPFGGAQGILAELERASVTPRYSLAHALSAQLHALRPGKPPEDEADRWQVLPEQMKNALTAGREDLVAGFSVAAEPLVETFLDRTADKIARYELVKALLKRVDLPGIEADGIEKLELERRMLRLLVQQVWGSQAGLVHDVVTLLLERLLPDREALLRQSSDLMRWALDYRLSDGHTAVLLSMGRDKTAGNLELRSGRLVAHLPARLESPEASLQELLLRDIAARAWRGELRTNPAWSFLGRRVTVHSQGGCPMGADPETAVTGADGQVHGCPGLYVMDGAAFPTPVGVNPSATIAAVAEYKIECFLHGRPLLERWRAKEFDAAKAWANARKTELDPLTRASLPEKHESPESEPIGIYFKEVMRGAHSQTPPDKGQAHKSSDYRAAESKGIEVNATIETRLEATIEDLARFLEEHRRYENQFEGEAPQPGQVKSPPRIILGGKICLKGLPGPGEGEETFDLDSRTSFLTVFSRGGHGARRRTDERRIEYELHFQGEPWSLEGLKFLRNDQKFDVWDDSTTLYFDLFRSNRSVHCGILRVPAEEFFGRQLPSFKATNTDDPVRQGWALTAFGNFFLGHLADVYVPKLADAARAVARMARRTHV